MNKLQNAIEQSLAQQSWSLQSRAHPWPQLARGVWLKRDDELSASMSGSKLRKLASLSTAWQQDGAELVLACGGAQSNHLPALLQVIRQTALACQIWVWGRRDHLAARGNQALLQMLVCEEEMHWLAREDWPQVTKLMQEAKERYEAQGKLVFIVCEGGKQVESLWGAMTQALDVLRNERQHQLRWQHIFVDSGTGMSAIGLYCGLALCRQRRDLHVVLIAGDEKQFRQDLQLMRSYLQAFHLDWDDNEAPQLHFHRPPTARSFGATNQQIFTFMRDMARQSGVILDAIYTAKLAMTCRAFLEKQKILSPSLVIHSGGIASNDGFWTKILKT
ncbi:MAG: 1-aminocyclopropane-1-carboxylate deaminase/D-cysteine desulfhydrase [Oligoflexus sp.]